MLFADSFVVTGCHGICKDYAYTKVFECDGEQYALAVLSDGCTSSKHSDLGARILCHSLISCITKLYLLKGYSIKNCQEDVIHKAMKICDDFGVSYDCLDATLIGCITNGRSFFVIIWGDGFISTPNYSCRLEYESNAPFYISYLIDKNRCDQYKKVFEHDKLSLIHYSNKQIAVPLHPTEQPTFYLIRDCPLDMDSTITIASDGINSFSLEQEGVPSEPIEANKVVLDFTSYKNFHGEFVQRRVTKTLKEYNKLNMKHFDDISFASIHVMRNNETNSIQQEDGPNHSD